METKRLKRSEAQEIQSEIDENGKEKRKATEVGEEERKGNLWAQMDYIDRTEEREREREGEADKETEER